MYGSSFSQSYSLSSSKRAVAPLPPKPTDLGEVKNFVTRPRTASALIEKASAWVNNNVLVHIPVDAWVAGGSVRSIMEHIGAHNNHTAILDAVSDFDIYFTSEADFNTTKNSFENNPDATLIRTTPFSEKYELNGMLFDLVSTPHDSAVECIRSFDFTVCCGALDGKNLYHHKDYFLHTTTKTLELVEISNPVAAIARLQKYAKKGFEASNETILTIAKDIAMLDPSSENFNLQGMY